MNSIDLSYLPRKNNKIDWNACNNDVVYFTYKNITDFLYVVKNVDKDHVSINYKNNIILFSKISLVRCCLGKLFNFSVPNNYKYNIGDIIDRNLSSLYVNKQVRINYGNKQVKGYLLYCNKCNKDFEISEANLKRGDGCPYCSHHKVLNGITDIATTDPYIIPYLKNKNDAYCYSKYSNKYVEFICPECNTYLGLKKISDVINYGISCFRCGDGVSYPNKFLYNLLDYINVDYIREGGYDWCVFPSYTNKENFTHGRYDCIIPSNKIIIEMDGGLGHGYGKHSKSSITIEEQIYRDTQKNIIAQKHGYHIIRIPCNYNGKINKFDCCKCGIIKSELSDYFDFSKVNWNKINILSEKSIIYTICDLYNSGLRSKDISNVVNLHQSTVIDYLHKGTLLKLCSFETYKTQKRKE